MPDQGTNVLYVLSTLAQTCAALAALIGALALYRLQHLKSRRAALYEDIYAALGRPTATRQWVLTSAYGHGAPVVRDLLAEFDGLEPTLRAGTWSFWLFETWTLLVIGASLVGFNYVATLASSSWTFWALWAAAVGTVAVTGYCVFGWTKE